MNTIQDRGVNFRSEEGNLFLVRCYACDPRDGKENYLPAVASGTCVWCGWKEDEYRETTKEVIGEIIQYIKGKTMKPVCGEHGLDMQMAVLTPNFAQQTSTEMAFVCPACNLSDNVVEEWIDAFPEKSLTDPNFWVRK